MILRPAKKMLLNSGDDGTRFIMLVVVMMSVLSTLAVGGALTLAHLRSTWVDAVAGHITIEIPASDGQGLVRSPDTLHEKATAAYAALSSTPGVTRVDILDRRDVEKLVSPWLGEAVSTNDMPLPVLIGVTLSAPNDEALTQSIRSKVSAIDPPSIVETHQSWLADLRRFSLILLLAAGGMATITIACCIVAVAGAVAARLSEHQNDIDLLHVMGATDAYIGQEFVDSVVRSVGGAAVIGTVLGLIFIKIGAAVAGEIQNAMLPAMAWKMADNLWFLILPALVTLLCYFAARFTVLRSLGTMP
ncbi:MAG: hypothetical protein EBQ96_04330 [Proteobacteria bacterium]|nr:hypothetical protein [Pseudomonadota bacterium]